MSICKLKHILALLIHMLTLSAAQNTAISGTSTLISTNAEIYLDTSGNPISADTGCISQHDTGTGKLQNITVYGDGTWIYAFQFDGYSEFAPSTACDMSVSTTIVLNDKERISSVKSSYK